VREYYAEKLSAERLRRCYEIAPPAVQGYLEAEIEHLRSRLRPGGSVLELGCGFGRVLRGLAGLAGRRVGIDLSRASLELARAELSGSCNLLEMDAARLGFRAASFDAVACVQNGVSTLGVQPARLAAEALRVARPGAPVLLSTYAEGFWEERLAWFRLQAAEGLLGPIDEEATGEGVIACRDGFRARTLAAPELASLARSLGVRWELTEVGGSSLFLELRAG